MILSCLSRGTSLKEGAASVMVSPGPGEKAVMFSIDEQSNPGSRFRQEVNLAGPICDGILYFEDPDSRSLCFVELKSGRDIAKAVDQVVNTATAFKNRFASATAGSACKGMPVRYKAYIKVHGSAPTLSKLYYRQLKAVFERAVIREASDMTSFVRA